MAKVVIAHAGQEWHFSSDAAPPGSVEKWSACMLVSDRPLPLSAGAAIVEVAIAGRCKMILAVSPNAEAVHDHLDGFIEDAEAFDVVTAFHSGEDALEAAVITADAMRDGNPFFIYSDSIDSVEEQIRNLGYLETDGL